MRRALEAYIKDSQSLLIEDILTTVNDESIDLDSAKQSDSLAIERWVSSESYHPVFPE